MGYSRRKEAREVAETIAESNRLIQGVILGQLCAAGMVTLNVKCRQCDRRGRYNLGRLITAHGPTMLLPQLAEILSVNCGNRSTGCYLRRCGIYFPDVRGPI